MIYIEPKRKPKEPSQAKTPEEFLSLCDEKLKEELFKKETEKIAEKLNTLQVSFQKTQKPKLKITFTERETLWKTAKATLEDIKLALAQNPKSLWFHIPFRFTDIYFLLHKVARAKGLSPHTFIKKLVLKELNKYLKYKYFYKKFLPKFAFTSAQNWHKLLDAEELYTDIIEKYGKASEISDTLFFSVARDLKETQKRKPYLVNNHTHTKPTPHTGSTLK